MTKVPLEKFHTLQKALHKSGVLDIALSLKQDFQQAEIYLVGGSVRDALLGREGYVDIDLVVSKVKSEELLHWLEQHGDVDRVGKSFGVFKFVPSQWNREKAQKTQEEPIDIALPRTEHAFMTGGYHDFDVQSDPLLPMEKDLERRDFTMNAMALNLLDWTLVDPFGGEADIQQRRIRSVFDPEVRFNEDFTRMLRAVRLAVQLDFVIESKTAQEIQHIAMNIKKIAVERVREEFNKILLSNNPERGLTLLQELYLLKNLIPELEEGIGITQNKSHIYTVFVHNVKALQVAADRNYPLFLRLAALFHDIGKPRTKQGEGYNATFYNHDIVGARMTRPVLERMKYPKDIAKKVTHLVRQHMFYYSRGQVTDAGVRRLLIRLGPENIEDFLHLRFCDRIGMGRPKAKPYKLLELERRLQEVQMDPIAPKMLALDGNDIMRILQIPPGPRIGLLMQALLNDVLSEPEKNTKEYLEPRLLALQQLSDEELKAFRPDVEHYEEQRKKEFFGKYKEIE